MSNVSIFGCILNETTGTMAENGYRMTTLITADIGPQIMSWVTTGGTICSFYEGMLSIKGSLPSGLQSFMDAGGTLHSDHPEVAVHGEHSLPTETYERYVWRLAALPPHPVAGEDNYDANHAAYHAAKEQAFDEWDAARNAVHGSGVLGADTSAAEATFDGEYYWAPTCDGGEEWGYLTMDDLQADANGSRPWLAKARRPTK
jgi:hypothetical protein